MDIRDPAEPYSAADFVADATARWSRRSLPAGNTPLLVGGTMLYFKAFLEGLAQMPAADPAIRREIEAQAAVHGWPHMHGSWPRSTRSPPRVSIPIIPSAWAVRWRYTAPAARPLSDWHDEQSCRPTALRALPDIRQLAICPAIAAVLHQRIAARFEQMMAAGFLDEVRAPACGGATCMLTCRLSAPWATASSGSIWRVQCSLEEAVEQGGGSHPAAGQAAADLVAQMARSCLDLHR